MIVPRVCARIAAEPDRRKSTVTTPTSNPRTDAVSSPPPGSPRPKPTLAQRVVGFTFLSAFGATMLTVVLTGLSVRSPSARRAPETPRVTLAIDEPRTIDLEFGARATVADVEVTVDLPPGVELESRAGERRAVWQTRLAAGDHALPLTLVARSGAGGQLAAQLRHGDERRTFVFDVVVEGE
jgi:hypothetical protein